MYRIDGKLVAMGVLDILPLCVSSTYFLYDPEYAFLSLGVISALQDIQWVQEHIAASPETKLRYYYLGYYVHSCPKVRYKVSLLSENAVPDKCVVKRPLSDLLMFSVR